MYTPNSIDVYTSAYSGALAGMLMNRYLGTDDQDFDPTFYDTAINVAGTFAMSVDLGYNNTAPNENDLKQIELIAMAMFSSRYGVGVDLQNVAFWDNLQQCFQQILFESKTYMAANVTTSVPGPGGISGAIFFDTVTENSVAGSKRMVDVTNEQIALYNVNPAQLFFVNSLRRYFRWAPACVTATDLTNFLFVNPSNNGGAGRFVAVVQPDLQWQMQGTWFWDATNGNNEWDGTAQTHAAGTVHGPLKNPNEWQRRTNNGVLYTPIVDTIINQVGDADATIFTCALNNVFFKFIYQGVLPAATFSGTLSAVANLNAGTSTFTNATSTWNPTTELFRLAFDSTANKYAWIEADLTGNNALMSPWAAVNLTAGGTTVTIGNAAVNDSVSTFVLPKLGCMSIQVLGGGFGGPAPTLINNLDITGNAGRTRLSSLGQQLALQNVKFSTNMERDCLGVIIYNNCLHSGNASGTLGGNDAPGLTVFNAGGATSVSLTIGRPSQININSQCLFSGCFIAGQQRALIRINDGSWKSTATPIQLTELANLDVRITLWGAGNTGTAVDAKRGCDISIASGITPTLTGNIAGVDLGLGGSNTSSPYDPATRTFTAAINNSWAHLVATIGAGGFGGSIADPAIGVRVGVES